MLKGGLVVIKTQSKEGPAWCRTDIERLGSIQRLTVSSRAKITERLAGGAFIKNALNNPCLEASFI